VEIAAMSERMAAWAARRRALRDGVCGVGCVGTVTLASNPAAPGVPVDQTPDQTPASVACLTGEAVAKQTPPTRGVVGGVCDAAAGIAEGFCGNSLGQTSQTPQTPDSHDDRSLARDLDERAAIIEFDARVPREWAEGYARLCAMTDPAGVAERDWLALQGAAGRLLDRWGPQLAEFGWTVGELSGAHRRAPWARLDRVGLVRFAMRFDILDVAADAVTFGNAKGARSVIRRRYDARDQGWTLLWDLAPKEDKL
jgi:hypothetical protein